MVSTVSMTLCRLCFASDDTSSKVIFTSIRKYSTLLGDLAGFEVSSMLNQTFHVGHANNSISPEVSRERSYSPGRLSIM